MIKKFVYILSILFISLLVSGCSVQGAKSPEDREVIYQVSTINALLNGSYDGQMSITALRSKGNLGIGTFEALDGEMILLDGSVYQAKYDGTVVKIDDQQSTPFAAVTIFDEDQRIDNATIANYEVLQGTIDKLIRNPNLFYAFKISGDFSYVKVRSVPPQQKPYPILTEVTKDQPTFEYKNVKGYLVGFWCPPYVNGINVPGYHLHFISEDRTQGGHLLEVEIKNASILADETPSFQMTLSDNDDFAKMKLDEDKSEEIKKVEK